MLTSQGDALPSGGISLFGLNNHGSLRNGLGSGFEDSGRGCQDLHSDRRSFSQGGAVNPGTSESRFGTASRSFAPRGSVLSLNGGLGTTGQLNDLEGFNRHLDPPTDNGVYANPLPAATLSKFEAMAKVAGLDSASQVFAMQHAEVFGKTNRHLSQAVKQGQILMEVSNLRSQVANLTEQIAAVTELVEALVNAPSAAAIEPATSDTSSQDASAWSASPQLLLSAYTALKNPLEGCLQHSLFNVIRLTIAKEGLGFTSKHLPAQHQGVEEASATKRYYSAIKDSAKHAREKVHIVVCVFVVCLLVYQINQSNVFLQVLVGIHDPKTGEAVDLAVPNIRSLVQRRREAARIVLKGGKGSESIWGCVYKQLANLRLRNDEKYTIAFYRIIFDEDCQYFDGTTYFQDLKERKINLDLPSEEAVMARVAHNAAQAQSAPQPNNVV
ncbi:uncharacterized protein MELLADRAFT_92349 [Melampsora larici-populina 98AG31]|uniref:Uncharacterized protein n=1 Tax=Melampsora larici-populina (strain 98AG31 / pathotype 3-4-7) TaxID=747676 RepID=F4R9A7_MELLP|nr:uncharacterized protein MELLADRAFT_92349 [Melampsora larici-populina 98AG31]EGG11188.1 hypothetical protein MELLADRAFT_92349 [Melampsora larici-populina 98AG31]